MSLFNSFIEKAPNKVFISCALGAFAGIAYALLIPLILVSLQQKNVAFSEVDPVMQTFMSFEVANYSFARIFLAVCVFVLVARTVSKVMLTRVAIDVTTELRINLYNKIASAPIIAVENVGSAKMLASMTNDVPKIVAGAKVIPELLINAVTLIGMLGFLLYLNAGVFWFVMQCIFFGALTYQIPIIYGSRYLVRSRGYLDQLHMAIEGLIHGAKELKLNEGKKEAYFKEVLIKQEYKIKAAEKSGYTVITTAINYGDLISFFVIGAVSFIFINYHSITSQELIGVIMALLYITGPIAILLNFFPDLAVAKVSLNKVNQLFDELPVEQLTATRGSLGNWQSIKFKGVTYQYGDTTNGFKIGPVDLELKKGELTFIVGGNGSGKSTLSKLITQHYLPEAGQIYFGDTLIDQQTLGAARDSIAAIYSDYHLFDQILGVNDSEQLKTKVDQYLKLLGLEKKVTFAAGKFSTLNLSDGQKRRLALVVAYIDNKDFYLFDEWAADQDPGFKAFFYRTILPELKAKGKAVVVISHDEHYFDIADQIIVMNEGQRVLYNGSDNKALIDTYVTKLQANTLTGHKVTESI